MIELETIVMVPRPVGSGPHEGSALGVDKGDSGMGDASISDRTGRRRADRIIGNAMVAQAG
jgi:hypothetical protein